jgi:hypothetical protein
MKRKYKSTDPATQAVLDEMNFMGIKANYKAPILTEEEDQERKASLHEESDLQLSFCNDVKKKYPELMFIRHEREKSRSHYMGNLFKVFNSVDGVSDWECLTPVGYYNGMYIEFKKPGEHWLSDGTVKERYAHQYLFIMKAWQIKRPAYFCNDRNEAMRILDAYISGTPLPMQQYSFKVDSPYNFL